MSWETILKLAEHGVLLPVLIASGWFIHLQRKANQELAEKLLQLSGDHAKSLTSAADRRGAESQAVLDRVVALHDRWTETHQELAAATRASGEALEGRIEDIWHLLQKMEEALASLRGSKGR